MSAHTPSHVCGDFHRRNRQFQCKNLVLILKQSWVTGQSGTTCECPHFAGKISILVQKQGDMQTQCV